MFPCECARGWNKKWKAVQYYKSIKKTLQRHNKNITKIKKILKSDTKI